MKARRLMAPLGLVVFMTMPLAGAAGAAAVPGPPRGVFAVQSGSNAASVTWRAPLSNGGAAINGYVVTPYLAGVAQAARVFNSVKTTEVVSGLQMGKSYRFSVAARNAAGKGVASAQTGAMIAGAPGQPVIFIVTLMGPGELRLSVRAPSNRAAGRVLRFDVTCKSSDGGVPGSGFRAPLTAPTVFVSGLTPGKTYKCTATATNAHGTGLRSKATAATPV